MATRSTITAKLSDGTYRAIYCHFDGYLDGVGRTLQAHYTDQAKIEALLALGSISVLGAECTAPEGHSYGNPKEGFTVAYYRDRGEGWDQCAHGNGATAQAALADGAGCQSYNYLWDGQAWSERGKPLAQALAENDSDA